MIGRERIDQVCSVIERLAVAEEARARVEVSGCRLVCTVTICAQLVVLTFALSGLYVSSPYFDSLFFVIVALAVLNVICLPFLIRAMRQIGRYGPVREDIVRCIRDLKAFATESAS
jgi:hypothetical protein